MKKVFCIRQKCAIQEGTAEMWSYRVFTIDTFYGITQPEECRQKMSSDEYNVYYCLHKVEGILCL